MVFYQTKRNWQKYQQRKWKQQQEILNSKKKLKDAKKSYKEKKKMPTSKVVMWFMILLLFGIIVFTGWATVQMITVVAAGVGLVAWDFTPLVGLISAIAGQVIIVLGYFVKSGKENSVGGITYQAMMNEYAATEPTQTVKAEDPVVDQGEVPADDIGGKG